MSKIIGHRGCAGHAPENTLAGLRDAQRMGLSWVESDATLLSDGTVVLFHDDTLDRCSDQSGFIRDQQWPQILRADVGGWFGQGSYVGERIPLLKDALSCVEALGIGLNLELKVHQGEGRALADAVAQCLLEICPQHLLISSFDLAALQQFATHNIERPLGGIFDHLPENGLEEAKAIGLSSIHLWERHVTSDKVRAIQKGAMECYCFTVNDKLRAETLFKMGVTGVFSDFPDRL